MKKILTALLFLCFFVGFFLAEVVRFDFYIFHGMHSTRVVALLALVAFLSGWFLFISFQAMGLLAKKRLRNFAFGGVFGVLFFSAIFYTEDYLSEQRLAQTADTKAFSQIIGHCGVYAGQAVLQFYRLNVVPSLENTLSDYEMSSQCRMRHFNQLIQEKKLNCGTDKEGKDEVQCRIKWMGAFAEKGYWNVFTRAFFFAQIQDLWAQVKGENSPLKVEDTSWMDYAVKDHDLAAATAGKMKQAGIEEQFSDEYLYYKQKDDFDNLNLTKNIFEKVSAMVAESDSKSPEALRYGDVEKEAKIQCEKIPEMEKDLQELAKRISYNPSR